MPERSDAFAPRVDDTVECERCGDDVPVADAAARFDSVGGYVCFRCDD